MPECWDFDWSSIEQRVLVWNMNIGIEPALTSTLWPTTSGLMIGFGQLLASNSCSMNIEFSSTPPVVCSSRSITDLVSSTALGTSVSLPPPAKRRLRIYDTEPTAAKRLSPANFGTPKSYWRT
jgi:hypothetical protein